jgi:hypothetical protein
LKWLLKQPGRAEVTPRELLIQQPRSITVKASVQKGDFPTIGSFLGKHKPLDRIINAA